MSDSEEYDPNEIVSELTHEIRFGRTRNREDAEKIIRICKEENITDEYFLIRGLVFFHDLLGEYLSICTEISPDDYSVSLARCIENNLSESLDLLLAISDRKDLIKCKIELSKEDYNDLISLRLLTQKYHCNMELYERCRKKDIFDPCLEIVNNGKIVEEYPLYGPDEIEDKFPMYGGYRYVYHICMYYPKELTSLRIRYGMSICEYEFKLVNGIETMIRGSQIVKKTKSEWDNLNHLDCTAEAICDYFKIEKSNVKEFIDML